MRVRLLLCLICVGLSACMPVADIPGASHNSLQNEIRHETGDVLVKYTNAVARLSRVAGPMFMANYQLCPFRAAMPGFTVISDFDVPKDMQNVAYERLLLTRDARVLSVIPGTDAWDKGVRAGDTLLALNGIKGAILPIYARGSKNSKPTITRRSDLYGTVRRMKPIWHSFRCVITGLFMMNVSVI